MGQTLRVRGMLSNECFRAYHYLNIEECPHVPGIEECPHGDIITNISP
jgi:hypothetical protein